MMQQALFAALIEQMNGPRAAASKEQLADTVPGNADVRMEPPAPKVEKLMLASRWDDENWNAALKAALERKIHATAEQLRAFSCWSGELRSRLHFLLNSEDKLQQLKHRQDLLDKGKVPPGMKPYQTPWFIPSLDEKSKDGGQSVTITVP